ncbi:MAG: 3'-5' exonuclease domain-containing protein 2, partial [Bacteroidaceae bacterium]|nr:3'-5' exonuclease domain-containing protein 2 [Bacteroidaceae bacterium]
FSQRISKTQQLSNWEADILTEAQKGYAATDAWACIQLYEEINRLQESGYMLEFVPEPEPQVTFAMTSEQIEARQERKRQKEHEKRRRKSLRAKERRHRATDRKNKETLKNINTTE